MLFKKKFHFQFFTFNFEDNVEKLIKTKKYILLCLLHNYSVLMRPSENSEFETPALQHSLVSCNQNNFIENRKKYLVHPISDLNKFVLIRIFD